MRTPLRGAGRSRLHDPSKSGNGAAKTAAARVYLQIKQDIIDGVYPPGAHLVRMALAKRYGVSHIPIMEACYRLELDGLVENSPQLGAHVVELSEEVVTDDLIFREAIECQTARLFAERATDTEKEEIRELAKFIDSIEEKMAEDRPEREQMRRLFQEQHSEFHLAVARASRAKILLRQMQRLWYRRLMISGDFHHVKYPVPGNWHGELAEALASGDPDVAERRMRVHIYFRVDKFGDSVREVLRRGRAEYLEIMLRNKGGSEE